MSFCLSLGEPKLGMWEGPNTGGLHSKGDSRPDMWPQWYRTPCIEGAPSSIPGTAHIMQSFKDPLIKQKSRQTITKSFITKKNLCITSITVMKHYLHIDSRPDFALKTQWARQLRIGAKWVHQHSTATTEQYDHHDHMVEWQGTWYIKSDLKIKLEEMSSQPTAEVTSPKNGHVLRLEKCLKPEHELCTELIIFSRSKNWVRGRVGLRHLHYTWPPPWNLHHSMLPLDPQVWSLH